MESLPGYDAWKTRSDRDEAERLGNYDEADRPDEPMCECGHPLGMHDYEEDGSCQFQPCECRMFRRHRLVARTPAFQAGEAGSEPAGGTNSEECPF